MLFDDVTIDNPSTIEESVKQNTIKTEFEDGIIQTRPRYTRLRHSWLLTWNAIKYTEYKKLKAFYTAQKGEALSFTWLYPYENTNYNVRFSGEFKGKNIEWDIWQLSLTLEEV